MYDNSDLCKSYKNIISVQQHIHKLEKELVLQKQLVKLKK